LIPDDTAGLCDVEADRAVIGVTEAPPATAGDIARDIARDAAGETAAPAATAGL